MCSLVYLFIYLFFLFSAHSFSVSSTEFSLRVGFGLQWLEMQIWLVQSNPSDLRIIDLTPVWPSMYHSSEGAERFLSSGVLSQGWLVCCCSFARDNLGSLVEWGYYFGPKQTASYFLSNIISGWTLMKKWAHTFYAWWPPKAKCIKRIHHFYRSVKNTVF